MQNRIYLGLDAHASHCVLGGMDTRGKLVLREKFPLTEGNLISQIVAVKAKEKLLVFEESTLATWLAGLLREYVDELTVCDPRQNALISKSARKSDQEDVYNLCRLLRLGELKRVYHAEDDHRVIFKDAVQHYLSLRDEQVSLKNKVKAKYHRAGVLQVDGRHVFTKKHRDHFLAKVPDKTRRSMLSHLYAVLDAATDAQGMALRTMLACGKRYSEIGEFMKMPGVGPIGAHVFDAFIQTPHRFATRQKLWRYCKLGIVDRSSNGKPLMYKRLDRAGNGELKAMSYRAWLTAARDDGRAA